MDGANFGSSDIVFPVNILYIYGEFRNEQFTGGALCDQPGIEKIYTEFA